MKPAKLPHCIMKESSRSLEFGNMIKLNLISVSDFTKTLRASNVEHNNHQPA